ncbi:hypothetical protein GQ53DRAFT_763114 [Thozetella sp. PMI_491]|nr:hypothetical protein GQ53DRAFT_763114 [Thozetella sp. PMI_491]
MSTAWPSVSGCDAAMWKFVSTALVAWDPGYGLSVEPSLVCHPPQVTSWWDADRMGVNTKATAYSLGPVVCPVAYSTVSISENGAGSTMVACCPTGYTFSSLGGFKSAGLVGECISRLSQGQVVSFATRVDNDWVKTTSTVQTGSAAYAVQVNGWLIPAVTPSPTAIPKSLVSSSTDSTRATVDSHPVDGSQSPGSSHSSSGLGGQAATGGAVSSSGSSTGTVPGATNGAGSNVGAAVETTGDSSTGLSTGAKIGIGVGVPIGLLAIAAIFFGLWLSRQNKRKNTVAPIMATPPYEVHGDHKFPVFPKKVEELEVPPAQLPTPYNTAELPAQHWPR